jgi:hypothetical protein
MAFYVTRQSDDGAYSVEIAADRDFSGPGALVAKYAGEFESFDDPREAAETAIGVAESWRADVGRKVDGGLPFRCFTIAGNALVYPTVADAFTAPELRQWAIERYAALDKCAGCGQPGELTWTRVDDWTGERYCSESCVIRALEFEAEQATDDEEISA